MERLNTENTDQVVVNMESVSLESEITNKITEIPETTDFNLHAFKRIVDFIKSLYDEFSHLKNHARFKPLALYHRLITNGKYNHHTEIMGRHLNAFRQFCIVDYTTTEKLRRISFNERIFIDMDFFLSQSNEDTKEVIFSYLNVIKSLLNGQLPDSEKEINSTPVLPDIGQLAGLLGSMGNLGNGNPLGEVLKNVGSSSIGISTKVDSSIFSSMTDDTDILKILQSPLFEKAFNHPMVQGVLNNPMMMGMVGRVIAKVSEKKKDFTDKIEKMDIDVDRVLRAVFTVLQKIIPIVENDVETNEDVKYVISLFPKDNGFIEMFKQHYSTIKTSMEEWKSESVKPDEAEKLEQEITTNE